MDPGGQRKKKEQGNQNRTPPSTALRPTAASGASSELIRLVAFFVGQVQPLSRTVAGCPAPGILSGGGVDYALHFCLDEIPPAVFPYCHLNCFSSFFCVTLPMQLNQLLLQAVWTIGRVNLVHFL